MVSLLKWTGNFEDNLQRARTAIRAANTPPILFAYRGRPVIVKPDGRIEVVSEHEYRDHLSRMIVWDAPTRRGRAPWGVTHVTFAEAAELFPPFEVRS